MDTRRDTIRNAQKTTCEWLLEHPAYKAWSQAEHADQANQAEDEYEDVNAILWINGKPGAGKSTLMKFVHAHSKGQRRKDEIVISFFFNARGVVLEKTTLGVYRALLCQLLNEATDLQTVLDDVTYNPAVGLSTARLQEILSKAVSKLGSRHVRCFIDALDECDEPQVRKMVDYFEELNEEYNGKFKIYALQVAITQRSRFAMATV
ncbi:hypothetical protein EJ03DRAFT_334620 [Teratosphaeria nubilosa]|uniref:Nephrocystin 3-like N-terminal domain-containing protein n=1 Tax=Teratosphaeria nubilosa TaxID=161662 RepID=A0A6G1LGD4_9PEZI|nr:hypothetical protein EJ03DRAFT_334620 [Teratosphaeria nubilosa]